MFEKHKKRPQEQGPFLYEMHQHTAGCSACAVGTPENTVRQLKADGFAGMVLTNHLYFGNTGICRTLPWEDFLAPYIEAYERAKKVGDKLDFDVLFGMEEMMVGCKEVLLYGITPQLLLDHPELQEGGEQTAHLTQITDIVHSGGGLVYQAHPFRTASYIPEPWKPLPPHLLDGVEAYNACNSTITNAQAVAFAREHDLPMIAGSDAHDAVFPNRYGIACPHRIRTGEELVQVLKEENYELYIPGA